MCNSFEPEFNCVFIISSSCDTRYERQIVFFCCFPNECTSNVNYSHFFISLMSLVFEIVSLFGTDRQIVKGKRDKSPDILDSLIMYQLDELDTRL